MSLCRRSGALRPSGFLWPLLLFFRARGLMWVLSGGPGGGDGGVGSSRDRGKPHRCAFRSGREKQQEGWGFWQMCIKPGRLGDTGSSVRRLGVTTTVLVLHFAGAWGEMYWTSIMTMMGGLAGSWARWHVQGHVQWQAGPRSGLGGSVVKGLGGRHRAHHCEQTRSVC